MKHKITRTKNCSSCAFCLRNQETWIGGSLLAGTKGYWSYDKRSLDQEERNQIIKGNISFVGDALRRLQAWQKEYETRKILDEKENTINGFLFRNSLILPGSDEEEKRKKDELEYYGMDEAPAAPDKDYLSCYHEQWTEGRKRTSPVNSEFLKHKKCHFYYPSDKADNQTLEACEKTRTYLKERSNVIVTNALVIVGIIITLIAWLMPK